MGASPHTPVYSCSGFLTVVEFRRFEVSRFAPSGRPRSGLTLTRDHSKELALIVAAFAIGGYIANWAFGWWYDIPLKVDAINNALYQLLSKP